MYDRHSSHRSGWRQEFLLGVEEFITFATSQVHLIDKDKIKCSCLRCKNGKYQEVDIARTHICKKDFVHDYYRWTSHGELPFHYPSPLEETPSSSQNDINFFGIGMHLFDNLNPTQRLMVFDAAGPK